MAEKKETTRTIKRIFIASPGDLAEERKLFPKILQRINKLKAHSMGVQLDPLGWEDTLPGCGRPQALINQDVEKCDLFVMLLWKRWGSKPAENSPYSSGTEEEFELARRLNKENDEPNIFLYFRQVPEAMMADPGEQLRKVLDFRKRIEEERALLFNRYEEVDQWQDLLMDHVGRWLDGIGRPLPPESAPIPPDIEKRISDLEEQLRSTSQEKQDAQTKLREAAAEMGRKALAAAVDGRLTEAEELFARATQTYPEPSVINAQGLYYYQIGSLDQAEQKFRRLEVLSEEQSSKEYLAAACGNLGLIYRTRGDLDQAEEMLRKALALFNQVGAKPQVEQTRRLIAELREGRKPAKKGKRKKSRKPNQRR